MRLAVGSIGLALALGVGCADTLPAEDLRITTATPVAKLSAALLWQDFQSDPAAARAKYWGKAVEITGPVARSSAEGEAEPYVFYAAKDANGVMASLIKDRAAAILARVKAGERVTLRCFCHGLVDGNVSVRSCIQ